MLIWLVKYWIAIPAVLVTAFIAFGLHRLDVARIEARNVKAMDAQKAQLIAECEKAQQITEGVSHDYQEQLYALSRELDTLKRVHSHPECVPIAKPSAGCNGTTSTGKPIEAHGLRTDWLYDFAAEAERYRIQLIACQNFIKKERE